MERVMQSREQWAAVGSLEEFQRGEMRTVKQGDHQLVMGRTDDGEVFALDNRCPHEGYPLAQGDLKGGSLTCCWHNWKFDTKTGACTLGGEGVRHYATRLVDGRVEVDLRDPDPAEFVPGWLASFEAGLLRHENGRASRDGVRLLGAGYAPARLLADIALSDARRAEYGTTHVLAVAADCARFLDERPGSDAMYAIAPVMDLCGETNRRLPARERPAALAGADVEALRDAVEAEDAERAEGLLRGAFEAGLTAREAEHWLFAVLSDHFLDFGHPLIYLVKARELLDRLGDEAAEYAPEIYGSLLHGIVLGTREDTLPYWAPYTRREGELGGEFADEFAGELADEFAGRPTDALPGVDSAELSSALVAAVLDGSIDEAFAALTDGLRSGLSAGDAARALVAAAAQRMLRFDVAHDSNPEVAENWLWATHRFTFASAVRNAVERFDSPLAVRFLYQSMAWTHQGRSMDLAPADRVDLEPRPVNVDGILRAIAAKDPRRAVGGVADLVWSGADLAPLRRELEALCLADPAVRPIVVAHVIKTVCAAFEEYEALEGHPDRAVPLCAVVRFLASPVAERRVHSGVRTSIAWVAEGRMPRKLTQ